MNARRVSVLPTLAVVLAAGTLLAAAGALQAIRERRFAPAVGAEAALYLTSGATVSRLTRGYNALAADLYWIRAVQHYSIFDLEIGFRYRAGCVTFQIHKRKSAGVPKLVAEVATVFEAFADDASHRGSFVRRKPRTWELKGLLALGTFE